MSLQKVSFQNQNGETLVGRLELPVDQHPHNFAIFAHCFTCTKNLLAVKNISKALTSNGFGVLRFDFTGLGESEGDFANTNFSGNVEDLVAASGFLAEHYMAPTLLIGHSLGGAAVVFAAQKITSVNAIATIGAPSNPLHVKHLLKNGLDEIKEKGEAVVNLGGRDFKIKQQFVQDLEEQSLPQVAKKLRKPLLIMHSPQDDTVEIKNAEDIYVAAHHPKSFVSLDGADHLLSRKEDSLYVGDVISGWAKRYLDISEKVDSSLHTKHQVVASLNGEDGFTTQMKIGNHYMLADEPESYGGNDFGPSPYEFVSAGLSACTVMTIQMYAKRKGWPVDNVEVHISYGKSHAVDCENCESDAAKIDTFHKEIKLTGALDEKQKARIMQIADKCPVHRTLHSETQVISKLVD
ncbi:MULTISPECIES: bifunctional alpha/beta hydrolase/OsmC family protein [Flavobacteriaceae]|uniref:bifunctional alpha/beta hydrolase/OsmC family protein n=1 Tax=Flavobacteriaceae TaxID=49546 RepID=UPI0014928184|nr:MULTISPECIES: bifunctional alpha/beta hydrolase/OsmC family protein [Allomuricauda]MDC6365101.1 bifunctional alpha/beta hydrolase/OsmC family protein [Muricauda sp. AC10]